MIAGTRATIMSNLIAVMPVLAAAVRYHCPMDPAVAAPDLPCAVASPDDVHLLEHSDAGDDFVAVCLGDLLYAQEEAMKIDLQRLSPAAASTRLYATALPESCRLAGESPHRESPCSSSSS